MGSNRGSYPFSSLGRVTVAPLPPIKGSLDYTLPHTPSYREVAFQLLEGDFSGKPAVVTINGVSYQTALDTDATMWRDAHGVLPIYSASYDQRNNITNVYFGEPQGTVVINSINVEVDGRKVIFA